MIPIIIKSNWIFQQNSWWAIDVWRWHHHERNVHFHSKSLVTSCTESSTWWIPRYEQNKSLTAHRNFVSLHGCCSGISYQNLFSLSSIIFKTQLTRTTTNVRIVQLSLAANGSNFTCNEHIPNAELVATDTSSDSAAASPQGLGSSFPFDSPTM